MSIDTLPFDQLQISELMLIKCFILHTEQMQKKNYWFLQTIAIVGNHCFS